MALTFRLNFTVWAGTLRPGRKCIQRQDSMQIISEFNPHCVFLQIGGNDLSREPDAAKLARDIVIFADYIIRCYEARHVVIGQLLPRSSDMPEQNFIYTFNSKVFEVNRIYESVFCRGKT